MRRPRLLAAWAAVLSIVGASLLGGAAQAADVDLVVNVSSAKGVYSASETATYTVRVDNRGLESITVPATVTLTVPNTSSSPVAWEQNVTCVASGGAVCPTAFTRSGTTISATIPTLPKAGSLVFTVQAPGYVNNSVRNSVAVTATIAAGTGDTDVQAVTDQSVINVIITNPAVEYSTTATGPTSAAAQTVVYYDVVLTNTGEADSLYIDALLAAAIGTGTSTAAPVVDYGFTGITCLNETGGASCANLTRINGGVIPGVPLSSVPSGTSTEFGVRDMPAGSSVTLRFAVDTGRPACTTGASANRTITLTATIDNITTIGWPEDSALNPDNVGTVITTVPALPCTTGDVSTVSLTQPAGQNVALGGAFEYTALYSNLAGDTATNADIEFQVFWPGSNGGATLSSTPTCVPSGGATCPTGWQLSGAALRGIGAVLPAGGSLSITYTGLGGVDDQTVCRPQSMGINTRILPPLSFIDTNWVTNNVYTTNQQTQGNNARRVITTTAVGSPCGDSHDDAVQQTGPFTDAAATIPLVGPASPGQVLYFRSSLTNQLPVPYPFSTYSLSESVAMPTSNGTLFVGSTTDRFFRHQGADPAGITFTDDYVLGQPVTPFDTGIRCVATGGSTCPSLITATGGTGGGGVVAMSGWQTYWKTGTQPTMPAGSTLDFIATYKVPDLSERFREAGCVPTNIAFGTGPGNMTSTTANMTVTASVGASTVPATVDRNTLNDTTNVQVPIQITRCTNTLAIVKTALTPTMPLDRQVKYQIVVTNTSVGFLDLPRLVDGFSTDAPADIACVATTLSALCPTFTPREDVRRFADGSTGPITYSGLAGTAQFDFVWGTAGQPTMPPGSSVTFEVTVSYPSTFSGTSANTATFMGADTAIGGGWPAVASTAAVVTPPGSALVLNKKVNPVKVAAGQVVTFTVDIINTGAALPSARFVDELNSILVATNPTGYGNLSCRSLTAADGVLSPGTIGTTACPTFTSDGSGITGLITGFASNSGIRLTYTAVAPLTAESIPNIAQIMQDDATVTRGDTFSHVNFFTYLLDAVVDIDTTLALTGLSIPTAGIVLALVLMLLGAALVVTLRVRSRASE